MFIPGVFPCFFKVFSAMCCRVFSSMFIPGVSLFPQGVFCNVLQGVLFNVYTRCFLQCCYWMCSSVFLQGVSFPLPDVTPLKVAHVSLSRSVSLSVAALLQRVIHCLLQLCCSVSLSVAALLQLCCSVSLSVAACHCLLQLCCSVSLSVAALLQLLTHAFFSLLIS